MSKTKSLVKSKTKSRIIPNKNQSSLIERITTVHGTNHFSEKKGKLTIVWLLLMVINVFLTISFLMVIKDRYNSDQIVTKIYSDCRVDQVPFPAVSICNFNLVSDNQSNAIAKILEDHKRSEKEIHAFFHALPTLKNFGVESRTVGDFKEIMQILKEHYFTMDSIMEEVHQKCENLLLYCEFNRKEKKCENVFSMILTYEGYCCAFNYAALNDESEDPLLPRDDDVEYYIDESNDGVKTSIIATSQSGRSSGLRVVLNIEPQDYPSWSAQLAYGAKILINDPNDFPETSVVYTSLTLGESVDMKVAPMVFRSEADLRRVSPDKRGCWFHDEVALEHTDRYSYETCRTECKMKRYLQYCGCIPYKYPREKSTRICELEDLRCLNNMTVSWSEKEIPCNPACFLECNDKGYTMTEDTVAFLQDYYPARVTKDRNVSELSALQVYFAKSTCNCYKMSLLIDFNYFIATYGGIFGLSFGASIITLFEITYILFSSFANAMWRTVSRFVAKRNSKDNNKSL